MPEVNYLAVLAAAVSAFILGAIWYAPPVFGRAWQRETGLTDEQLKAGNKGLIFGGSFVLTLAASWMFALFLGPKPAFGFAIGAGFAAGVFWVATSFGVNYLFEFKSLRLFLINAGYHAAQFTIIGAILGLWH
jgi:hypothetical protein